MSLTPLGGAQRASLIMPPASPLTAFQIGLRCWVDSDGTEAMDELVDHAFAMITPVFDLSTDPN